MSLDPALEDSVELPVAERLERVSTRLCRLATDPAALAAKGGRVYASILRLFLPDLVFATEALRALARRVEVRSKARSGAVVDENLYASTVGELAANVDVAERYARAGVPVGMVRLDALRATHALLVKLPRLAREKVPAPRMQADLRAFERTMRATIEDVEPSEHGSERLHAIELRAVDRLIEAALEETSRPARRRALFVAARTSLTDVAAAAKLTPSAIAKRRATIGREIVRLDRVEAAGLAGEVGVLLQAKHAHARRDAAAYRAAMWWILGVAQAKGDAEVVSRADEALRALFEGQNPSSKAARIAGTKRAAREILGATSLEALESAYRHALAIKASARPEDVADGDVHDAFFLQTLDLVCATDGAFEVGGTLSPVPVVEARTLSRLVRHPTAHLTLERAESVDDLPVAIVEDPRTLLLDLASGRLLARRFVEHREVRQESTVLRGEARFFLLDGSSSMHNPPLEARARVRDSILLAELSSAMRRIERSGKHRPVSLRFRYFTNTVDHAVDVRTMEDAVAAIDLVMTTPRFGGTNIEEALLKCFDDIRHAVVDDPDLAHAQIVLVTDGEAPVSELRIAEARSRIDELPIRVSVIALGQENDAIREIVVRQRAEGAVAFYQHFGDAELDAMLASQESAIAMHPAETPELDASTSIAKSWSETSMTLLDELTAIERGRTTQALADARADADAFSEIAMELDFLPGPSLSGTLARDEGAMRDARALEARFERWFPRGNDDGHERERGRADSESEIVVVAIAELVETVGGDPLTRRADAIDLLERLLGTADLDTVRYARVVGDPSRPLRAAIQRVRDAVG